MDHEAIGEARIIFIYTDWANHYLAKSGHKRLIRDLQQDVTDGVLLAEIIQVVANEKIEDINDCPKNQSQMNSKLVEQKNVTGS
ncbi:hypothetical protein scyTo_0001338 [Scyliorhinus torazame]|uniref:Calponin-homology (CH) domain-containing protein n=1 Tax=Scyliorhinus torazame TaxID=75743 RepID=A0A401PC03_SCYTO|nr:hypothetical protein [Scyliorhinus torazame]